MESSSISYSRPAFLVCVGFMDPGKWATALEGGSRFGLELLWVLVASTVFAALLQCLSSRLGMATGRNLAQICHDEYPRYLCALLWFQCEVSIVILDLTMVLGIAMGLNALLGLSMVSSVILTAVDTSIFLFALSRLGIRKAEFYTTSIMGVVVLCFVIESLHSDVLTSAIFNGMLPRLRGETLYVTAGILGASVMPSNLCLHSALVQGGKQSENHLSKGFFHHSIIDIATGFAVALLINIAVLSSAAAAFHNLGHEVITLQDAQVLMEQILSNSVTPAAFGLALLCAGQLSTLTGTVAGQVALEGFVGGNAPLSIHRTLIKLVAILLALLLVWSFGSEGTYQVLIFSQVVLALQLPFAIVPLIKVTSSEAVMGHHKNPFIVEVISWVCVASIFFMDIWVVFDMFFGESDEYVGSGSWNLMRDLVSSSAKFGETFRILSGMTVVGVTTLSTCLLMWMIAAPSKAGSTKSYKPVSTEGVHENSEPTWDSKLTPPAYDIVCNSALSGGVEHGNCEAMWDRELQLPAYEHTSNQLFTESDITKCDTLELVPSDPFILQQLPQKEPEIEQNLEPVTCVPLQEVGMPIIESLGNDTERVQSQTAVSVDDFSFANSLPSETSSLVEDSLASVVSPPKLVTASSDALAAKVHEVLKGADEEVDVELLEKDDYDLDVWESLEQEDMVQDSLSFVGSSVNSLSFDEPGSGKSFSARSDTSDTGCGGSGSGSLSRLSGLGRAARRQFAGLLDDFWGKMYNLHGQPISQKHVKWQSGAAPVNVSQIDIVNHRGSNLKDAFDRDATWSSLKNAQKTWQKNYRNNQAGQMDSYLHSSYHSSTSSSSLFGDSHCDDGMPEKNERRYSSLRFPTYHDDFDSQPATIHGYMSAAYAEKSGNIASGVDSRPFFYNQQHLAHPSPSMELAQSFVTRSTYKVPTAGSSGNFQLGQNVSSSSVRSLLSTQSVEESPARSSGNSFLIDRGLAQAERWSPYGRSHWDSSAGRDTTTWDPLVYRVTGDLDTSHTNTRALHRDGDSFHFPLGQRAIGRGGYADSNRSKDDYLNCQTERAPLCFDEISPFQSHKDGFSLQSSSQVENRSLWSTQPFEQLFGHQKSPIGTGMGSCQSGGHSRSARVSQTESMEIDFEIEVLNSLRSCIRKLLRLDGSDWLFRSDTGSDEDLIGEVAGRERILLEADSRELHKLCTNSEQAWSASIQRSAASHEMSYNELVSSPLSTSGVPHCGEGCVWNMELVVSFGVWCIHRILELSLMESRPELWGKYTYVLNRLQGVLEPAFSKPRSVSTSCICVASEISDWNGRYLNRQGSLGDCGNMDLTTGYVSNGFSGNSYQGYPQSWPWGRNTSTCKGKGASASIFLDIIKDVETAIGARKGRSGTAAGDVAFPKGKENLASVLKRYKRRLANKIPGTAAGVSNNTGNRRSPASAPVLKK